jgi:hypothetical protein
VSGGTAAALYCAADGCYVRSLDCTLVIITNGSENSSM